MHRSGIGEHSSAFFFVMLFMFAKFRRIPAGGTEGLQLSECIEIGTLGSLPRSLSAVSEAPTAEQSAVA
jgi:hypothetical protein